MNVDTFIRALRHQLDDGGLEGHFLVRDLDTGAEIGFDSETILPAASLVKVPLALVTLLRIANGELDPAQPVTVQPGRISTPGPTGTSRFRYPAVIALDDLLSLAVSLSDGSAADALFELTPPAAVAATLESLGMTGIAVRHPMRDLVQTPVERLDPTDAHFAHELAIGSGTRGNGHPVPQLDVSQANSGSARAFVDLLAALWNPTTIDAPAAERVRELMAGTVVRWRLAPDFASDAATWSSKTGTLLNLRHEIGVVEHADGDRFAVAALTRSRVAAATQPGADALMGSVARQLRDRLRSR